MTDPWTNAVLADVERAALRQLEALDSLKRDEPDWVREYSLCRAISDASVDRRTGFEHQMSKELTDRAGAPLEHGGFLVPWQVFNTRADIAGTTTAGGYLIDAQNVTAADALRPNMLVGRRGANYITAPAGNVSLPTQTAVATGSWLTSETSQATEHEQVFGQVSFSPHTCTAYTEISRLLLVQGAPSTAEAVVRRDLISVVARLLDAAAIAGSGSAGQPHGIIGASSVQTFTGTTIALATVINAATALGDALNSSAGIVANRTTAGLLRQRQEASGSTRMLWEGSLIEGTSFGFPAGSNTAVPAATLILGSWNYLNIATWGAGIEVMVNPFDQANFQKGIVGMRAMLTCDVAMTFPSAFTTNSNAIT